MMGSKKCVGKRVITRVFVRCGETGLDIVREGGLVGEPGDEGIETVRLFTMASSASWTDEEKDGRMESEVDGEKEREARRDIAKFT